MIVNIPQKNFDDPIFLSALNGMLVNLVDVHQPSEVYFIRIDRWFDHKLLGYSGKTAWPLMRGDLGSILARSGLSAALASIINKGVSSMISHSEQAARRPGLWKRR